MKRAPVKHRDDDLAGGRVVPCFTRLLQMLFPALGAANAQLGVLSERPATLWSVRTAGRGPNGAGRARATIGSETSGGAVAVAVAVRWAVRNLPYAKSTVAPSGFRGLSASTPIRGGAA